MISIAALITVCEGEFEIAREAIGSLLAACEGANVDVQIVDDASPSHVGRRLMEHFTASGASVACHEWPSKLGFRGTSRRLFLGLSRIASASKAYDLIIKIDPDTLVLRKDLLAFLNFHCKSGRGLWGVLAPMRTPLRLLFLADLMPIGFQRVTIDGTIRKKWRLQRFRPVWWGTMGWKSLIHGFRFKYAIGPLAVFGGKTLAALKEKGSLSIDQKNRHGFLTSEDDVLMTVAVYSVGHPVIELRELSEGWDYLRMNSRDAAAAAAGRSFAVHPLTANTQGMQLRAEVLRCVAEQQGTTSSA